MAKATNNSQEFVMKHVFKYVSSMKGNCFQYGDVEEHFQIPWRIFIFVMSNSRFCIGMDCMSLREDDWLVETDCMFITKTDEEVIRRVESSCFGSQQIRVKSCFDLSRSKTFLDSCDRLEVEVKVRIHRMIGFDKKLRRFDEEMKDVSDIVLVVENEKFYVSKLFLASQSPYFKTLLLGNFDESRKSQVTLKNVDANDFQKFLEVLYGDRNIDDCTAISLLHLGDMYDTPTVVQRCEQFLLKESREPSKKKFELAIKYNMDSLKEKCLSELRTANDVRSLLPNDINQMDPLLMAALFEKLLTIV